MSTNASESWIIIEEDSDFSIYNFPFGVGRVNNGSPRCLTAIGNFVVDLSVLAVNNYFKGISLPPSCFEQGSLNTFIGLGKSVTNKVRERLIELFRKENVELQRRTDLLAQVLHKRKDVTMVLPLQIGDYTDFYSSKEHATNVGSMFRDPANALLPNWKHLPVAYHGRASSIVVSGTPLIRPHGQYKKNKDDAAPTFGSTQALDFELEMAFVIGKDSALGEPIPVDRAAGYIFGFVLFNDWSARDIQSWEYVPLGPFLSKNFMSSVSPWIVTIEALYPFKVQGPAPETQLLPYLQCSSAENYDINLEVQLQSQGSENVVSRTNFKYMYWNVCQQLAHHTINGCNVKIGDLMASGTISGPTRDSAGCMLELTRNGLEPIALADGSKRKFLNDGDEVIMTGYAKSDQKRVGFGEVRGKILSRKG
jgi:fumarylacetoacetase